VCNFKQRGDPTLIEGAKITSMFVEGVPSEYGTKETVAMLQMIDPSLNPTRLAANVRILNPPYLKNGEPATTKQVIITNLTISRELASFVAYKTTETAFPAEVYLTDKSAETCAVEISQTGELRTYIQILECAACSRRHIEAILLTSVQESLARTSMSTDLLPIAVRISTTRMEGQAAAGKHSRTLRRIPCSDGKILLICRDAKSVDALISNRARVELDLDLGPLPRIPLTVHPWQNTNTANLNRNHRATSKEAEARALAASTTPNLSTITNSKCTCPLNLPWAMALVCTTILSKKHRRLSCLLAW